jgi:tRNA nucleotidyltransferase (CCA-adding enzyme)
VHIVTTHKGTDFDALASIVAANLLYPGIVSVLPASLNPNVRAFLSLHKDLFGYCRSEEIDPDKMDKLTVVDINRWDRLDRRHFQPLRCSGGSLRSVPAEWQSCHRL